MLIEGSVDNFDRMIDVSRNYKSVFMDSTDYDEQLEYEYLSAVIKDFSKSDDEIMIARHTGRTNILRNLGDRLSEMIIPISYNKNSKYNNECPTEMFKLLLDLFKKGD